MSFIPANKDNISEFTRIVPGLLQLSFDALKYRCSHGQGLWRRTENGWCRYAPTTEQIRNIGG